MVGAGLGQPWWGCVWGWELQGARPSTALALLPPVVWGLGGAGPTPRPRTQRLPAGRDDQRPCMGAGGRTRLLTAPLVLTRLFGAELGPFTCLESRRHGEA